MTARDAPVEQTVHYPNGRIKYSGFLLLGEMHGAWSWYRTDGYGIGRDGGGGDPSLCRRTRRGEGSILSTR